ncbi:MAG TPA: tetratricopeptide repeat protein [Rhizomicrobium sp.]|nr:tetratricopeptide repeat protein [Rhizomicrobium sp.]
MKLCALLTICCSLVSACAQVNAVSSPGVVRESWSGPAAQSELYLGIVDGLIHQGRFEAAIAFLARYQKTGPETARFRKLTGDALSGAGRYDEAIAAYRGALKSDLAAAAHDGIARAEAARGDWQAAADEFRAAALLDPANAAYLNNLGYAQIRLNVQPAAAANALRRAYELAPTSVRIRNNLALALSRYADHGQLLALLDSIPASERSHVAGFVEHWTPDAASRFEP